MAEHFKINPGRAEDARRIEELEAENERLRVDVDRLMREGIKARAEAECLRARLASDEQGGR